MTDTDQLTKLQSAVAAIHNHLHAGNINAAHEACECALSGGEVSQPNLSMPQSARVAMFSARFNALCVELQMSAAFVAFMKSATMRGAVSIQIGGEVTVCKYVESKLGSAPSIYQGEHTKATT